MSFAAEPYQSKSKYNVYKSRFIMPEFGPAFPGLASDRKLTDAELERHSVEVSELAKAAGGIGCLTGVMERN